MTKIRVLKVHISSSDCYKYIHMIILELPRGADAIKRNGGNTNQETQGDLNILQEITRKIFLITVG